MKTLNRPVDRRERDIKKKLMAAVAMLLLSCCMVVTSTFAWFTLSTAPEVTGIQTTIGGNGNLEIALAGEAGTTPLDSTSTDGAKTVLDRNITWGNLVDLSDDAYGLNKVTLYPSALNAPGNKVSTTSMLQTPEYGADGRVTRLLPNVVGGVFDAATNHFKTSGYGVRGLGVSSSKTERQFAFSGALSNISNSILSAESAVELALQDNGPALTDIAIAYGLSKGDVSFTKAQMTALQELVEGTEDALPHMESAIVSFIDAILASQYGKETLKITDTDYSTMHSTIESLDVDKDVTVSGEKVIFNIKLGDSTVTKDFTNKIFAEVVTKYQLISNKVGEAAQLLETKLATQAESYSYTDVKTIFDLLMAFSTEANDRKVTVEGFTLAEMKANPMNYAVDLAAAMKTTGMDIELNEGSGVYYDIALLIGKLSSRFQTTVSVNYSGAAIDVTNALIVISSTPATPAYLPALATATNILEAPSKDGAAETNQVDDLYAFALDLYFRTNASNSKLVLQTAPAQRIYEDGNNTETKGAGSTVTFEYESELSQTQVRALLSAMRIVFINGDGDNSGEILAKAKLDVDNAVFAEDDYSVTANIYLYSESNGVETLLTDKSEIRALDQNTPHLVTTLVYLDGDKVTNKDVAASAANSMTGSLNLQFASTAELEAMDYTSLKQGDTNTPTPGNP